MPPSSDRPKPGTLAKPYPQLGRPSTLPEPWKTLAERSGGVGKLAARMGVDPSVIHRWAHGKCGMSAAGKALLDRLLAEEYGKK